MAPAPDSSYYHGNLRSALLARAEEVLAADGVDSLSLRGLARDLGVSHGAPARHFQDRQSLLDALALSGVQRLDAALAACAACAGDWSRRLRELARAYVTFATANPALLAVMYDVKHHPDASTALRVEASRGIAILADVLRDGQQVGKVAAGDPHELALVLFAAVHGVAQLGIGDLLDGAATDDVLDATLALYGRGLAVGPGGVEATG
ncbi:TetR/AcrR family transcriptional regulator [Isoptericola halotolerans]|uniref:TetR/AcrR family transcriptional regulator n=1 Tax=Isoptericola halotolerans TaxID=300560 RepID=UPI00388EB269